MVRDHKDGEKLNRDLLEDTNKAALSLVTASIAVISILLIATSQAPSLFAQQKDNGFLTYENPDYDIKIEYPANWIAEETDLEPQQVVRMVAINLSEEYISPVGFVITTKVGMDTLNLEQAIAVLENHAKKHPDARFVDSTNTALSGFPGFSMIYYDYTRNMNLKMMDTFTVLDNELFHLQYSAEPGYYDGYLPDARRMIDSFQVVKSNDSNTVKDIDVQQLLQQFNQTTASNSSNLAQAGQATTIADQLLEVGESLYVEGNYAQAIMYFDEVLALVPNSTGALYDKGLVLDIMGLHGDAIAYYDKVLTVQPDNINALVNKGGALGDLGRYLEAIEYFDKALALDPGNALATNGKRFAESYALINSPLSAK